MTMQITVPSKTLAELAATINLKDIRAGLHYILLDIREHDACLVVTDGSILATRAVEVDLQDDVRRPGKYLVYHGTITAALKIGGKKGDADILIEQDGAVRIRVGGMIVNQADIDGMNIKGDAWPDWRRLFKSAKDRIEKGQDTLPGHFQTKYMMAAAKLFAADTISKFPSMHITNSVEPGNSRENAAVITSPDAPDMAVLVMPVRVDNAVPGFPWWVV